MQPGSRKKDLNTFVDKVALPAWNRMGIKPVGVFTSFIGPDSLNLFVVLPHKNFESVVSTFSNLQNDMEYQKSGEEYLNTPQDKPLYTRMNSSLLRAFPKFPQIQIPKAAASNSSRIFELRVYESHSEKARQTKIDQFCIGSTIDIFHKAGMRSVFYGETIIGNNQPSLYYMLAFEDLDDLEDSWARFRAQPEWLKLSKEPRFANTVSHSTKWFLNPAPYSQL